MIPGPTISSFISPSLSSLANFISCRFQSSPSFKNSGGKLLLARYASANAY